MPWVWVENGNIFVAYSQEVVPQGAIEVPDGILPQDLVIDNGVLRLKTFEEKLNDLKQEKLNQLKFYVASLLSQTDWVIIKLQSMKEESWSDNEIQVEVQKYQPILEKRKRIREWNEQTEQAIQNAKTIEELEAIKIEFEG
jgi:hypothetical protein